MFPGEFYIDAEEERRWKSILEKKRGFTEKDEPTWRKNLKKKIESLRNGLTIAYRTPKPVVNEKDRATLEELTRLGRIEKASRPENKTGKPSTNLKTMYVGGTERK